MCVWRGVYDEYFFQGKRVPMPFSVKLLCALLHFNFPGGGDGVRTSGFQIIIAEKIHSIIVHEYQHVTQKNLQSFLYANFSLTSWFFRSVCGLWKCLFLCIMCRCCHFSVCCRIYLSEFRLIDKLVRTGWCRFQPNESQSVFLRNKEFNPLM